MDPEILAGDAVSAALLRHDLDEQATVLTTLARLQVHGVPVDRVTRSPAPARDRSRADYPLQRTRFWPSFRVATGTAGGFGLVPVDHPHPLLKLVAHAIDHPRCNALCPAASG